MALLIGGKRRCAAMAVIVQNVLAVQVSGAGNVHRRLSFRVIVLLRRKMAQKLNKIKPSADVIKPLGHEQICDALSREQRKLIIAAGEMMIDKKMRCIKCALIDADRVRVHENVSFIELGLLSWI